MRKHFWLFVSLITLFHQYGRGGVNYLKEALIKRKDESRARLHPSESQVAKAAPPYSQIQELVLAFLVRGERIPTPSLILEQQWKTLALVWLLPAGLGKEKECFFFPSLVCTENPEGAIPPVVKKQMNTHVMFATVFYFTSETLSTSCNSTQKLAIYTYFWGVSTLKQSAVDE